MTRPKLHHVNLKTSRLFWAPKPTSIGTDLHAGSATAWRCLSAYSVGSVARLLPFTYVYYWRMGPCIFQTRQFSNSVWAAQMRLSDARPHPRGAKLNTSRGLLSLTVMES